MFSKAAAAGLLVALSVVSVFAASTDRAPQTPDTALVKQRIASTVQWYRKNLRTLDSKCDAGATEALDAMADLWSQNPDRRGGEMERAWRASHKAVAAGCGDPLVLFVHATSYESVALEDREDAVRYYAEAASGMDDSKYSPVLKAAAHVRAASAIIANAVAKKANNAKGAPAQLEAAKDLLPAVAAAKDVPNALVLDLVGELLDMKRRLGADRKEEFDAILPIFAKARSEKDVLLPLLRARFFTDYAWDARGGRYADKLTDNAVDVFMQRVADAERELARAIAIDPRSPDVAPLMLIVELAQGKGIERMDSWFRYGIAVDPGNTGLYVAKLHYLEPRWHGTPEAMIEFGRATAAGKAWASRAPLILVNAYAHLADGFEDPSEFFRSNPDACREIKSVYDGYLALYPDSNYDRSRYALILYQCGDYAAANRQFQTLASDGRLGPFVTRANYENKRLDSAARSTAKRR